MKREAGLPLFSQDRTSADQMRKCAARRYDRGIMKANNWGNVFGWGLLAVLGIAVLSYILETQS